jgi:homospermidine synthase
LIVEVSGETDGEVIIDCDGYNMIGYGNHASGGEAIWTSSFTNSRINVNVKNCNFEKWFQAVSLFNSNSSLENSTFNDNYYSLVLGKFSSYTDGYSITGNSIANTYSNDIVINNVNEGYLYNNVVCSTPWGFYGDYNIYCDGDCGDVNGSSKYHAGTCSNLNKIDCRSF